MDTVLQKVELVFLMYAVALPFLLTLVVPGVILTVDVSFLSSVCNYFVSAEARQYTPIHSYPPMSGAWSRQDQVGLVFGPRA